MMGCLHASNHHKHCFRAGILAMVLSAAWLGFGCAPAHAAPTPKRIVVGGGDSFQPLMFLNDNGEPDGVMVQVWHLWSRKTGVVVEFKLMEWPEVIPALLSGEVDVVDGITYTRDRARVIDFSKPYNELNTYIYFHESLYGVQKLDELAGFPVGVLKGSSVQDYLHKHGHDLRLITYSNYDDMIQAALDGRIRVFVSEDVVVPFYFSKAGSWGGFRRSRKPVLTSDLRVGVRKGDAATLALVDRGMSQITRRDRERIEQQWTGVGLAPRIPWRWILAGALAALGGIALVILWNKQLRRKVDIATQTLLQSQERFLKVAENAKEWIWEVDADGMYTYSSPAVETILGFTPGELVGKKHFFDLFHPDERDETLRTAQSYFDRKEPFVDFVNRNTHKNGGDVWLNSTGGPILDARGNLIGFRGVDVDITQKRMAENELRAHKEHLEDLVAERTDALQKTNEQLLQSQKMEAIGVLAGGIAHDFNNILASISGTAELMQLKAGPADPNAGRIARLLNACRRARDLTMKLLTFARKEKLDMQTVSADDVILDVTDMLAASISPGIAIRTLIPDDLPEITVDRNQITQALLNLCINACDAMQGGGELTIQVFEQEPGTERTSGPAAPDASCVFRVSDTGGGVDPSVMNKIFEPFFTTKARGKGTGLGLSVTLGIIQNHGGTITVRNEPGAGAVFDVILPTVARRDVAPAPDAPVPESSVGSASVLIIDDDADFLAMAHESLELHGFRVRSAPGGADGLAIYREHGPDIDLVILDMLMPDMDGARVFHALRAQNPDARIILCSGYSVEGKATDLLKTGASGFVQKPFTFRELLDAMEKIQTA